MAVYLLDTNAVRSMGRATLEAARGVGHELLISPLTLWELLSHLNEDDFHRARANVLKAQECTVLHDPLAEVMHDVGTGEAADPGRYRDRDGVVALLDALAGATTYEQLQRQCVVVAGETCDVRALAENIEAVFDGEHDEFVRAMERRCAAFTVRYGHSGTINLGGEAFCLEALGLARGLAEDVQRAGCAVALGTMADRTVLGAGYAVARACEYVANVGEGQPVQIDANDLEDYFICLHLGASSSRHFVSDDRGARRAVNRTLAACRQSAEGIDSTFQTNVRVLSVGDFAAEAAAGNGLDM